MEATENATTSRRLDAPPARSGEAGLDLVVARRTIRTGAILAAIACGVFAVVYVLGGPREFVVPNALACIALLVVAAAPFRDPRVQLMAVVAIALLLLASQLLITGTLYGGVAVWFLIPTLGAMLVGARRIAAWAAVFSVAVSFLVVLADRFDWPMTGSVVLPNQDLVLAISILGCIVVMGGMAAISLRARHTLMADLEARNRQLAEALAQAEAARAVALDAGEAKDRFFANLTHEIRTPLNGIAGTAELLHASTLPPEERAMADALIASTSNLVNLVNAMLEHARMRAGRVDVVRAPARVVDLAADVEALFGARAAEKGLELHLAVADDVPDWVETDALKVGQVIGNLVGNAVKFTEEGCVEILFDVPRQAGQAPGGRLEITVADTGPGIPAEIIDEVFEPFVQGDASMTRRHGGTGLGLAIASQVTALLDGSLTVTSQPGAGSTFRLEIPAPAVAGPVTGPVASVAHPAPGRTLAPRVRVLLAEDNEVNRIVGSRMLERLGADVVVAADGVEAVRLACAGEVGLILMDLQMPTMDGIAAAREIRRWEAATGARPAHLLAMTGNAPEDYREACGDAGMDGFITKPVDMSKLREIIEAVAAAARSDAAAPTERPAAQPVIP